MTAPSSPRIAIAGTLSAPVAGSGTWSDGLTGSAWTAGHL
jgi:hypothetical protein